MRTEALVFYVVCGFLLAVAGTYAWATNIEITGTLALIGAGALCGMCGLYFGFVARRIELRPEDRGDGEVHEGAGEVGFFAPGSYWPVALAFAVTVTGAGLSFTLSWLVIAGLAGVVFTTSGLMFEFYTGTRRSLD
ncbi:MAG TPA: cytochrome c oxidase subunit 4 [Micromonosporaceae bacterium]|nr:cytochrome c oxidase subunit 4 [Micromonosporaceae bacterium]